MDELLTVYDRQLRPVALRPREVVHREGMLHQVVFCWILSRIDGEDWLWFQQRSFSKKDFPGLYDIAMGGHLDPGETPEEGALRELREELGISLTPSQLIRRGMAFTFRRMGQFRDRQAGVVFLTRLDHPAFAPGEEVARMVRISRRELLAREAEGRPWLRAVTQEGEELIIPASQWCRHGQQYWRLIEPAVREGVPAADSGCALCGV